MKFTLVYRTLGSGKKFNVFNTFKERNLFIRNCVNIVENSIELTTV